MKTEICSCVNPIWSNGKLSKIIAEAKHISKKRFLQTCEVFEELKQEMKQYPNDFAYYQSGNILFYTHSAIEYFYN